MNDEDFKNAMLQHVQESREFREDMLGFKQDMLDFKQGMLGFKQEMIEFKQEMMEFKQEMMEFKKQTKLELQNQRALLVHIEGKIIRLQARLENFQIPFQLKWTVASLLIALGSCFGTLVLFKLV